MIVRSVKIEESLILSPLPTEEIVEAYQGGDAKIWVDFRDPVEAEVEVWLDALGWSRPLWCRHNDLPRLVWTGRNLKLDPVSFQGVRSLRNQRLEIETDISVV